MENLFPQEGLWSVIILLKSSIFPLTFMVLSRLPSRAPGPGRGSFHKLAVITLLLTINPPAPASRFQRSLAVASREETVKWEVAGVFERDCLVTELCWFDWITAF